MDLIAQILAALVIILALVLYNRSASSTPAKRAGSTKADSGEVKGGKKAIKKKKKKGSSTSNQKPTSSSAANASQLAGDRTKEDHKSSTASQPQQSSEIPKPKPKTNAFNNKSTLLDSSQPSKVEESSTSSGAQENRQGTDLMNGLVSAPSSARTNEQRREEIIQKKAGKGEDRVADMIDRDIQPETTYERVARIPGPESQSNGFGPHDYEEWEELPVEEQGGWENVSQSKSSRLQSTNQSLPRVNGTSNGPSPYVSNNPFAALPDGVDSSWASVGKKGAAKSLNLPSNGVGNGAVKSMNASGNSKASQSVANSEPTKKQRQNAAKAAAKKAQKEAEEKERLDRLAKHKKEVEAERMKEFYTKSSGSRVTGKGSGPKASVNENGALVWD